MIRDEAPEDVGDHEAGADPGAMWRILVLIWEQRRAVPHMWETAVTVPFPVYDSYTELFIVQLLVPPFNDSLQKRELIKLHHHPVMNLKGVWKKSDFPYLVCTVLTFKSQLDG